MSARNRDVEDIIAASAAHFCVRVDDILAARHNRVADAARSAAMAVARRVTTLSLSQVGANFGRAHSTVQKMTKEAERRARHNPRLALTLTTIAMAFEEARAARRHGAALEWAGAAILAGLPLDAVREGFEARAAERAEPLAPASAGMRPASPLPTMELAA